VNLATCPYAAVMKPIMMKKKIRAESTQLRPMYRGKAFLFIIVLPD